MPGGEAADYFVMTDRGEAHGRDAATLRTVGLAAELARRDDGLEIGGDGVGGAGKDAVRGRFGRMEELLQGRLVHVEDRVEWAETEQFCDNRCAHPGCEDLWAYCALLRREDAHPNLFSFGPFGPELKEPLEIAGLVCDLAGDGAVDRNSRLRKVLQYTLVGRRCATNIVFGLEAIYGDDDIEALEVGPVSGNGTEGAGDDLDVNAAAVELRQDRFELSVADQRVAADEGDVERLMFVDYAEDVFDQRVFFIVRQLAQGDVAVASEMGGIEGVASGTAEGTFAGELDR